MPVRSPVPSTSVLVTGVHLDWLSLLALACQLAALVAYLAGVRRLAAWGRPWPRSQTGAFIAGLFVAAYATAGGLARFQADNVTAHVIQLLLLFDIAPPLLAFGAPLRLAVQASGRRQGRVVALARSRVLYLLTRPLVAFGLYMASICGYFLTPVYGLSVRHPVLMGYVELHLLAVGVLMWAVVVARDSLPGQASYALRFGMVLAGVPFFALVGLTLGSAGRPLDAALDTLGDTRSGGDALWALAELFVVVMLGYLFVDWAREEEKRAVRADRQLDAALAAARAASGASLADGGDEGTPPFARD
jgi:putative copper resistance protein D